MMSSKVKTFLISLISVVILSTIVVIVVLNYTSGEPKAETIDDIVEHSFETEEVTTDLEDGSFVRIQFNIITDGKKAQEEISKRGFQINNVLIKELATMNEEDFKTGLDELEDSVKDRLNELMTDGQITEVYTINKILQ